MFFSKSVAAALILTTSFLVVPQARASETSLLQMRDEGSSQEPRTLTFRKAEHCEFCEGEPGKLLSVVPFERRPRIASRGLEVAGVTLGAIATAAGATLLAMHGRCSGSPGDMADSGRSCSHMYTTRLSGVATLSTGVVILGTSLVAMILDSRRGWTPSKW